MVFATSFGSEFQGERGSSRDRPFTPLKSSSTDHLGFHCGAPGGWNILVWSWASLPKCIISLASGSPEEIIPLPLKAAATIASEKMFKKFGASFTGLLNGLSWSETELTAS